MEKGESLSKWCWDRERESDKQKCEVGPLPHTTYERSFRLDWAHTAEAETEIINLLEEHNDVSFQNHRQGNMFSALPPNKHNSNRNRSSGFLEI
jgi:hypothetical protein